MEEKGDFCVCEAPWNELALLPLCPPLSSSLFRRSDGCGDQKRINAGPAMLCLPGHSLSQSKHALSIHKDHDVICSWKLVHIEKIQ